MLAIAGAKKVGLRRWLVSRIIDRFLSREDDSYFDWTKMNRSWLEREQKPIIVYYNDLVGDPITTVRSALDSLGIELIPNHEASIPSFAQLKNCYPDFFRKGVSGDWKQYFSPAQEMLFSSQHQAMMKTLNFPLPNLWPTAGVQRHSGSAFLEIDATQHRAGGSPT